MDTQIFRSGVLTTIPQRKVVHELLVTIKNCNTCSTSNATLDSACEKCTVINTALSRYAESNIPLSIGSWK